ncbi:MAG: nucleotidyltransferase domain-containing protein [Thermomicrobiales bacterium]|nr:nucleotidyltransferase domain-containing protein [Thermomicrobiales bacterium]
MISEIETKRTEIIELCERYGVLRLGLFGSAARDDFKSNSSDLDFLVLFDRRDEPGYVYRYLGLAEALEALFGRDVDLVTEYSAQSPWFRTAIERDLVSIYERPGKATAA